MFISIISKKKKKAKTSDESCVLPVTEPIEETNSYGFTIRMPKGHIHKGTIKAHGLEEAMAIIKAAHPGSEILQITHLPN